MARPGNNGARWIVTAAAGGIVAALANIVIAPLGPPIVSFEIHIGTWFIHLNWPLILLIALCLLLGVNGCITIGWLLYTGREKLLWEVVAFIALVFIVIMAIHFAPPLFEHTHLVWPLIGRITLCLFLIWSGCIAVCWLWLTGREKILGRIFAFVAMVLIFIVVLHFAPSLFAHIKH